MEYYIEVKNSEGNWELIASFQDGLDRDDCLDFLADKYSDCKFRKKELWS